MYKLNTIEKEGGCDGTKKLLTAKAREHDKLLTILGRNIDVIYCKGICEKRFGEAGSGLVVYQEGGLLELYHGVYKSKNTSKRAGIKALYQAMLFAKHNSGGKKVQIFSNLKCGLNFFQ